jgi:hypothetical protein
MYLILSAFPFGQTSLLSSVTVCFSLWYLFYVPEDIHHQHIPAADVSHLFNFSGPPNGIL